MPDGELGLAPKEHKELRDRVRSRTLPAEDVRRARLILLLAQGKSYLTIRRLLGCNANFISRWKSRFEAERLAGLYSRHSGRAAEKRTPARRPRSATVRVPSFVNRISIAAAPRIDGDSVDQTVRHALNILHAAGIFLNVGGGSTNGRALALVEAGDGTRALAAFRRERECEPAPVDGSV